MSYKIINTGPFAKEFKKLSAKYPSLKNDFRQFLDVITINPAMGSPLGNNCFKIRLAISSKGKGKSGGARIITYEVTQKKEVVLISIYDKSVKTTISDNEIQLRLNKYLNR